MKRKFLLILFVVLVVLVVLIGISNNADNDSSNIVLPEIIEESQTNWTFGYGTTTLREPKDDGTNAYLIGENLEARYIENNFEIINLTSEEIVYEQDYYVDNDFRNLHTEIRNNTAYIVDKEGNSVKLFREFSDGFEDVDDFRELFIGYGEGRWGNINTQSPTDYTVEEYVDRRKKVFAGEDFVDNRISIEKEIVHSGKNAVRFEAVSGTNQYPVSKSLLNKEDLYFVKGDDLWYEAWYYLEKDVPSTFADFESKWFDESPGVRTFIRHNKEGGNFLTMEVKFLDKPVHEQYNVEIPLKEWVKIKLHIKLSNEEDGLVEIWQNEEKILESNGRTMPLSYSVINAMQVGITATSDETILIVDDIRLSDSPF